MSVCAGVSADNHLGVDRQHQPHGHESHELGLVDCGGYQGYSGRRLDEEDYGRGEISELKEMVNGITESLSVFAHEATHVSREVGTEV